MCQVVTHVQDTFQVGFVVMDTRSGVFDNNGGKDYTLPLAGASTEQEILDRRSAIYEAAERERLAVSPFLSRASATRHECTAFYEVHLCGPEKMPLISRKLKGML